MAQRQLGESLVFALVPRTGNLLRKTTEERSESHFAPSYTADYRAWMAAHRTASRDRANTPVAPTSRRNHAANMVEMGIDMHVAMEVGVC